MFDLSDLKTRVLASAGIVTAGGLLATASGGLLPLGIVVTPTAVALGTGLANIFGSILTGDLHKTWTARRNDAKYHHQNHDLTHLVASAIQRVLYDLAKTDLPKAEKQHVESLATYAKKVWDTIHVHDSLDGIQSDDLTGIFARAAAAEGGIDILDEARWLVVVASIRVKAGRPQNKAAEAKAAAALTRDLYAALREMFKRNPSDDGRAYAALNIDMHAAILNAVEQGQKQQPAQFKALGDKIEGLTANIEQSIAIAWDRLSKDQQQGLAWLKASAKATADAIAQQTFILWRMRNENRERHDEIIARHDESSERDNRVLAELEALRLEVRRSNAASQTATGNATPRYGPKAGQSNIPRPSNYILHRPDITAAIHATLFVDSGRAAITAAVATAAGGYGKTVAAQLYAYEHAEDFPGGRFQLAMETSDLAAQLGTLAPHLGLPGNMPFEQVPHEIKRILETGPPSLLILDNVPSLQRWAEFVASGLLPVGACHVLITTRKDDILLDALVGVPKFTNQQAWATLARFRADALDEANVEWIGRILRATRGLPAVVAAVGSRMRRTGDTDWIAYWDTLTSAHPDIFAEAALPELFVDESEAPDAAQAARWNAMIDDAFAHLRPERQRALQYAAFIPEDMIPRSWMLWLLAADKDDGLSASDAAEGDSPAAMVDGLLEDGILTASTDDGRLLSLHRLWGNRIRLAVERDRELKPQLLTAIGKCAQSRRGDIVGKSIDAPNLLTDAGLRWELAPLAALCASLWEQRAVAPVAELSQWIAVVLRQMGRYDEAKACIAPVVDHEAATIQAVGESGLATSYSNLALILKDLGELPQARSQMERAIEIDEKAYDADHPTLATSYSNLALILQGLGDLPGARSQMERAIEIDEKVYDADHPTLATRYHNMAGIAFNEDEPQVALAWEEKANAILRKHFDNNHPYMKISDRDLATYRAAVERDAGG